MHRSVWLRRDRAQGNDYSHHLTPVVTRRPGLVAYPLKFGWQVSQSCDYVRSQRFCEYAGEVHCRVVRSALKDMVLCEYLPLARIHRCGAALGLEQGVRAVGRDGPRSIPINGAGGGLWLELVAPMAVLGSGAGGGSAGQHAREDNRGPGRCDSVGWLSSLVDVSGAVGAVRQAMAGLAIEPGRE